MDPEDEDLDFIFQWFVGWITAQGKPADVYATARKYRTAARGDFPYQHLSFSIASAMKEVEHGMEAAGRRRELVERANFFEQRATEYLKATKSRRLGWA
jgi:hypothetical protein